MKTESTENLKPKSQYTEEAVQLAIAGQWDEAVELNRFILDKFGADEGAQNRLGKALTELGKLEEAKAAYDSALKINPLNTVARKNSAKLETLLQTKDAMRGGPAKVDLNLFVEEMGKTVVTALDAVTDADVCSKVAAGDLAELRVEGDGIEADTVRGVRIGSLEPKLARRLIKFIQGGNRYQVGVTSCDGSVVKVIVREVYQDPRFAGKPSFPITRKRDVEFRPYSREGLVTREVEVESFAMPDEEDLEPAVQSADFDEGEEGMHEVEDDAGELDFGDLGEDEEEPEEDEE